jgi:hypothetical protein
VRDDLPSSKLLVVSNKNMGEVMNRLKIAIMLLAAVLLALLMPAVEQGVLTSAGLIYAQDDWKTEFETVCAKTQDPGALSDNELKELVQRCDKLKPLMEKLDETQRKVYLKRLQMCRNLFVFVLESREKK